MSDDSRWRGRWWSMPWPWRVAAAQLPPMATALLQWVFWSYIEPHVWFLWFPAVFASSWIGGPVGGVLATGLSVLLVAWLFVPLAPTPHLLHAAHLIPTLALTGTGLAYALTHDRLRRGERRLRAMFDQAGDGIFIADREGRYQEVNAAGARMLGMAPEQIIGRTIVDLIPPRDIPRLAQARELLLAGHTQVAEWTLRRADGSWLPVEITANILKTGQWQALVRDISERRRAESQQRLAAAVFDATHDGILVTDAAQRIVAVNPAMCAISGFTREEMIGRRPSVQRSGRHDAAFYRALWDTLQTQGHWRGELWNRRKNGEVYPAWEHISVVRDADGQLTHYVAVLSDITPIKDAEARLLHLAHHDTLTGLPNRLHFAETLRGALARAGRHGGQVALLFIDLDRFKVVNDSLGHAVGDELLVRTAARLRGAVRGEDLVARLGGDEFTVVAEGLRGPDDAAGLAAKLIETLSAPLDIDGHRLAVGASVGIALYPADARDADHLCKAADAALYHAKDQGRGTSAFYTPDITERAHEHLAIDQALRLALQRPGELQLHYQPLQHPGTGEIVAVEALMRWRTPQGLWVPPDRFIPIAEHSALINELGAWAVATAAAQARAWLDEGVAPRRVAINVSGRQVLHDHLVETVQAAMDLQGLHGAPLHLELELTESVLKDMDPGAAVLGRLRALGVHVAIDDFGTGYSSLARIKELPIDTLKIDRLFVRNLPDDANSRAVVSAIVSMSHALGLRVVAEGVETLAQLAFLREAGCDEVQGFLFGQPADAAHTTELLRRQSARRA